MSHIERAISIVTAAGKSIREAYDTAASNVSYKPDNSVVTSLDYASDQIIKASIADTYPNHALYTEESGFVGDQDAAYLWIADPLDGTTNAVRGLGHINVALALLHQGKPVVAAVYQPLTDELFHAEFENGAYYNSEPMQSLSSPDEL